MVSPYLWPLGVITLKEAPDHDATDGANIYPRFGDGIGLVQTAEGGGSGALIGEDRGYLNARWRLRELGVPALGDGTTGSAWFSASAKPHQHNTSRPRAAAGCSGADWLFAALSWLC